MTYVYQNDPKMPPSAQVSACAFALLATQRKTPWTVEELGAAWNGAIAAGIISGDLNKDGDLNDPGEAVIQDWQALCNFLRVPLQYLGKFPLGHPTCDGADKFILTSWINPKNGFIHWVNGDHRPVAIDTIYPASVTVRVGHLHQLQPDGTGGQRVFRRI